MRIVALYAVANRRGVNLALYVGCFLVGVAGNAESYGSGCEELYAGGVFVDPDLVTTGTAHRNCRMNRLTLCLIFMALGAGSGVLFGV